MVCPVHNKGIHVTGSYAEAHTEVIVGECRGCGARYDALLEFDTVIMPDGSLMRHANAVISLPRTALLTIATDPGLSHEDNRQVFLHWEPYSDKERTERAIDIYLGMQDMQEQGIYRTEDEVRLALSEALKSPDWDIRETQCGTMEFFNATTRLPIRMAYTPEFSDRVSNWLVASLM